MLTFDIRVYRTAAGVRSRGADRAVRGSTRLPVLNVNENFFAISVDKPARGIYFLIFLRDGILVRTLPS
jgi:hypothetical protein